MTKPLTVQKLHSVLRRSGHARSRSVKVGRRFQPTDGYTLDCGEGDRFAVGHYAAILYGNLAHNEVVCRMKLRAYAETLNAAGIGCEIVGDAVVVPKGEEGVSTP